MFSEKGSYELPKNNDNKKKFCTNFKCYIMKELLFVKELISMKHVHQKSVLFVTIGIF